MAKTTSHTSILNYIHARQDLRESWELSYMHRNWPCKKLCNETLQCFQKCICNLLLLKEIVFQKFARLCYSRTKELTLEFNFDQMLTKLNTAWKVSIFGVILVRIFPHPGWLNTDRYSESFRVGPKCGKILTNTDTFHVVKDQK